MHQIRQGARRAACLGEAGGCIEKVHVHALASVKERGLICLFIIRVTGWARGISWTDRKTVRGIGPHLMLVTDARDWRELLLRKGRVEVEKKEIVLVSRKCGAKARRAWTCGSHCSPCGETTLLFLNS